MPEWGVAKVLPEDLVSIIHNVKLNESGWWRKAKQDIVLCALFELDAATENEIRHHIEKLLGLNFLVSEVSECLSGASDKVVRQDGKFQLSGSAKTALQESSDALARDQRQALECFRSCAASAGLETVVEELYSLFRDELLRPWIRSMGARAFQLISEDVIEIEAAPALQGFLAQFSGSEREAVRKTITEFFSARDDAVRNLLILYLNSHFLIEASSLSEESIERIQHRTGSNVQFDVFVDTNFLFSLIGAHENPSDEAAEKLLDLIVTLPSHVKVRLLVLRDTLDEAARAIANAHSMCSGLRLTSNMIAVSTDIVLGGFAQKYIAECRKANQAIDVDAYFQPYEENLLSVVRSRGVELFNEDTDELRTSQPVIDDLLDQEEFERRNHPERPKSHDKLMHDLVLYHFVLNKRSRGFHSPIEARYWVVTIDFRLLAFDGFKAKTSNKGIICLHPATFVQMLQFWLPRTSRFEAAVYESFRQPFLFYQYDHMDERVTLSILRTISRFENAEDFSQETIARLLTDDALRSRLVQSSDIRGNIELIESALSAQLLEGEQKVAELRSKLAELESSGLKNKERVSEMDAQLSSKAAAVRRLQLAIDTIQETNQANEIRQSNERMANRWVWKQVVLLAVLQMLGALACDSTKWAGSVAVRWAVAGASLALQFAGALLHLRGRVTLRDMLRTRNRKAGKWVLGALMAVALSIASNAIYDVIKQAFGTKRH